jgi:hypothetical protein
MTILFCFNHLNKIILFLRPYNLIWDAEAQKICEVNPALLSSWISKND